MGSNSKSTVKDGVKMKLFLVVGDTCKQWGASIYCFAVCDTMEQAIEESKKVRAYSRIEEVELNQFKTVYLGGYVE